MLRDGKETTKIDKNITMRNFGCPHKNYSYVTMGQILQKQFLDTLND